MAVEIDPRLAALLPRTVAARRPDLADRLDGRRGRRAARPGAARARRPTALVANLPYNVAVPVLLHLLELLPTLDRALVLVQAEVAERLAAPPGRLGVRRPLGQGGLVRRGAPAPAAVGRKVFWPEPNVDSGLVALVRRPPPAG